MKLTDANKIRDYVKEQINPYGKPFEGSVYEFGLKLIKYLENMSTDYDIDKVVEELDCDRCESCSFLKVCAGSICCRECHKKTIEIVKQGCVSDDVFEWKLEDEEADLYITERNHRKQEFDGTLEEYNYKFCPYCGKKIKAVK